MGNTVFLHICLYVFGEFLRKVDFGSFSHFVLQMYYISVTHSDICSGEECRGKSAHRSLSTYKSISLNIQKYFSSHYFCISSHRKSISSSHYFCILSFQKRSFAKQLFHSQDTRMYLILNSRLTDKIRMKKTHFFIARSWDRI